MTSTQSSPPPPPSLLAPAARGGENPHRGLGLQEQALLALVPVWLAQDGFTSATQEHFADFEALFFSPATDSASDYLKEFSEAKNYRLGPTHFWHEIGEFRKRAESRGYRWFRLICAGLSDELKPLKNGLRAVRGPYEFLKVHPDIAGQAYSDYEGVVRRLGKDAEMARFLYERVFIDDESGSDTSRGPALFHDAAMRHLTGYDELPGKVMNAVYERIATLFRQRINETVTRREIESAIAGAIPDHLRPAPRPIRLHTLTGQAGEVMTKGAIPLDWAPYFARSDGRYPGPDAWDRDVTGQLERTLGWAREHRSERRVLVTGGRRLSGAVAIGSVFSAVSGYAVELEHREGALWATDNHPVADTAAGPFEKECAGQSSGPALVVSVGVISPIREAVERALSPLGLNALPRLHLHVPAAITSPQEANLAARWIKESVNEALLRTKAREVHLFYKGPSHLALFIGHRLNAIGASCVRCYEWAGPEAYSATCTVTRV